MSELEAAQNYLRMAQDCLYRRRCMRMVGTVIIEAKAMVLAGLSWVWDAQQRAKYQ